MPKSRIKIPEYVKALSPTRYYRSDIVDTFITRISAVADEVIKYT